MLSMKTWATSHYDILHLLTTAPTAVSCAQLTKLITFSSHCYQNMSARTPTRAALRQGNGFASRQWTAAQMAAGLHRKVAHGDSDRMAVEWVNSHTPPHSARALTRNSLQRMYATLPASLRHPATSSEGQLLEHIHSYQSAQRERQNSGLSLLTSVEEALLVDWIVRQYNMNAPASPDEVRSRARELIEQRSHERYDCSLKGWYQSFLQRQPGLSVRIAENMPKSRLNAEQKHANITQFFSLLRKWRQLNKSQIYAADETGVTEDGSRKQKVVVPRGVNRVYRSTFGFYEHVSILHIGNAAGDSLPPVWIFKGVAHDAELAEDFAQFCGDSVYGSQRNGYFTNDHFLNVLRHFVRYATSTRPLLLIMDGASSHINEESLQYATANEINILLLPAHTTHLLQVADVAVFRPFKNFWRHECERVRAAKRRTCAPGEMGVKRSDILPAALAAWTHATTTENVISGFRATGIYPFKPLAYLKSGTKHNKSTSLTSLPPLLSPSLALTDPRTPILAQLGRSPALADPPPPPTTPREATKKRVRRTLDTSAGVLLTGAATMQLLREAKEAAEQEERAKKQKVVDRQVKRVEKERVSAEKKAARLVKRAARVAEAAVKAAAKEEKKRKRTEARHEAEAADEDKENVNPNVSAVVRAAPEPARYVCTVVKQRGGALLRMRKSV